MTSCFTHLYSGVLPCAWPGCEQGLSSDELTIAGKRFSRQKFDGLEGEQLYAWLTENRTAAFDVPRLVRQFVARLHDIEVEGGDSLFYHYTSVESLEAILDSDELWLSDYRSLNDTSELSVGREVARAIFQEYSGKPVFELLNDALEVSVKEAFFVGSFSQVGDCLNQWRAYADSSRGVSIGLEPLDFHGLIALDPQAINLMNVSYDPEIHEKLFKLIATLTDQAMTLDASRGVSEPVIATSQVGRLISEVLPICKNPGFADERECRLVVVPCLTLSGHLNNLSHRTRRIGTREAAYITTATLDEAFRLPIRKVITGPLITDGDFQSVDALAKRYGFAVYQSNLPLRRD